MMTTAETGAGRATLTAEQARQIRETVRAMRGSLAEVVVGLDEVIEELLIALFSGGHALLVGVPGLAKTLLIRSVSDLLELDFRRIQFTPDLMPSDITGTEVITQGDGGERHFSFLSGPVFCNVLLADEINRTPPKTQASLMEAMEENQVTSGGQRYPLEAPFLVFATQNPIEQEGTYPLPAGQLDRFMFNIKLDYPSFGVEEKIARRTTSLRKVELSPAFTRDQVLEMQAWVKSAAVPDPVLKHAIEYARRSRPDQESAPDFIKEYVSWGVGPRAGQALIVGAKARALLDGRTEPTKEDVDSLVLPVFRHRIIPNFQAEADGITADLLVRKLLATVTGVGLEETEEKPGWGARIRKIFLGD